MGSVDDIIPDTLIPVHSLLCKTGTREDVKGGKGRGGGL